MGRLQEFKAQFELANKLIFVKAYEQAERILTAIVNFEDIQLANLIVHLRRIELAAKMDKIQPLLEQYQRMEQRQNDLPAKLCLILVRQYGELMSSEECVAAFHQLLASYGPNQVTYYGLGLAYEVMGNHGRAVFAYQKSIESDASWYPSYFGLSQVYYQMGKSAEGDQNFFVFEKLAPFNVYGNFETHRELFQEFLDKGRFQEAEAAINMLSQWWHENKGRCPEEIQIYEYLACTKVKEIAGSLEMAAELQMLARKTADYLCDDESVDSTVAYFLAKIFEEFNEREYSLKFLSKVLSSPQVSTETVQKIGAQLLGRGQPGEALSVFENAQRNNPNNTEVKFCLLVCRLKEAKKEIEPFLNGKEKLRSLMASDRDSVETMALLHSLLAQFDGDPELHLHMGDMHFGLGNQDRARRHFERMYELDPYSVDSNLKLASFLIDTDARDQAADILVAASQSPGIDKTKLLEIDWLRANLAFFNFDAARTLELLRALLKQDPWNVSYLCLQLKTLQIAVERKDAPTGINHDNSIAIERLNHDEAETVNWKAYHALTERYEQASYSEVVYVRLKLAMLYDHVDFAQCNGLIRAGLGYDSDKVIYDFMALVNTNFDSLEIYWSLGRLFKERWQLETSNMWLNYGLEKLAVDDVGRIEFFTELSDNWLWLGDNRKAIEFGQMAAELLQGRNGPRQLYTTLAHAYLKLGEMPKARRQLEFVSGGNDFDTQYLKGLLHYRDGHEEQAKEIWKPLIKVPASSPKAHYLKQELLKFYYHSLPYLKAN